MAFLRMIQLQDNLTNFFLKNYFMTTDTMLAIFSVIATIIFGYFGIRYTLKYRKKTEIIFLKNSCISLFKAVVKNLDDIEINFQGKRIDENLILFKGTFFNNGNIDIDQSIVHKPLEIELPAEYSWIRHKLIDSSDGLNVNSSINGNKLIFEWDLLKESEYFTFDSLVEFKNTNKEKNSEDDFTRGLIKNMKINHRITNLKKVNKENTIPRPMPLGGLLIMSIFILGIVIGAGYLSFGQFLFPDYKLLNEVNLDSKKQYLELEVKNSQFLNLLDENGDFIKQINTSDLSKVIGSETRVIKKGINYWSLGFLGFFSIVYFILWIVLMVSEYNEKRLYKKLKAVALKHDELNFEEKKQVGIKLFELKLK